MKALTYVEIDVDFCANTWTVPPCGVRTGYSGGAHTAPIGAAFDGVTDYLTGAPINLPAVSTSKTFTLSMWVKRNATGTLQYLLTNLITSGTPQFFVSLTTANFLNIVAKPNSGGTILSVISTTVFPADGLWHHVLASFDLTSTSKRWVYLDDATLAVTWTTYTNTAIDFRPGSTTSSWAVGGTTAGASLFSGSLMEVWLFAGVYLDLSVTANRRLFIDANLLPVYLGSAGATPTGSSPQMFFTDTAIATWPTNKGSGGGFTLHGAITEDDFVTPGSTAPCFNTRKTCQVSQTYNNAPVTLRFAVPTDYLPPDIPAYPCIAGISFTPATISLGQDMGQRASLSVSFTDFRHSDTGAGGDPYLSVRGHDAFKLGTFWGKFRARQPYLQNRSIRLIRGYVGQAITDMETHHFIIDSTDGVGYNGQYTITAKDVLVQANTDKAQAPIADIGYLSADMLATDTSLTLNPSGVGGTYPASGFAAIGGSEIVSYTRSGDVMTIVRAQKNTVAATHNAQDRVQRCLIYSAQNAADIISDLFQTYASIPSDYVPLTDWETEVNLYNGQLYSAVIAEPTSVSTLVSELIQQAGLIVWWDDLSEVIRMAVLRQISTDSETWNDDNLIQGSLNISEQPNTRLSQVWTYFGLSNPLANLTQTTSYKSIDVEVNEAAEENYGAPAILKIFSRWIPALGRTIADRLNDIQLARFVDPPRMFSFQLFKAGPENPRVGVGYQLQAWPLQTANGDRDLIPIQITRLNPGADYWNVEAQEMRFAAAPVDTTDHQIIIDVDTLDFNMRTVHDSLFRAPQSGDTVTVTIYSGIYVGASTTGAPAFTVGSWPAGVTLKVICNGIIEGAGGRGGDGSSTADATGHGDGTVGLPGGSGFYTRTAVTMVLTSATINGGGGGGGGGGTKELSGNYTSGSGGGGGAGYNPGLGGTCYDIRNFSPQFSFAGYTGSRTAGGAGGTRSPQGGGGTGGAPGHAGNAGGPSTANYPSGAASGGAAGAAIDGVSYVTKIGTGTINGSQIN